MTVLILGATAAGCSSASDSSAAPETIAPATLLSFADPTDLVVRAERFDEIAHFQSKGGSYFVADALGDVSVVYARKGGPRDGLSATLSNGDTIADLVATDPLGDHDRTSLMSAVAGRGLSMYVALQHEPILAAQGEPPNVPREIDWTLGGVILVNPSDMTVVAIVRDPALAESPRLLSASKAPISLDTLLAFVAEVAAARDGRAGSGPVGRIYSQNTARPTAREVQYAQWRAQPGDSRPLDPELTPPEVLAQLTRVQIATVIADSAIDPNSLLVIRNDVGVSEALSLAGSGESRRDVLAPRSGDWIIEVSEDHSSDTPVVHTVTTIKSADIHAAFALRIELSRTADETYAVKVTPMSAADWYAPVGNEGRPSSEDHG